LSAGAAVGLVGDRGALAATVVVFAVAAAIAWLSAPPRGRTSGVRLTFLASARSVETPARPVSRAESERGQQDLVDEGDDVVAVDGGAEHEGLVGRHGRDDLGDEGDIDIGGDFPAVDGALDEHAQAAAWARR
jgi:hypothetical protein